MGSFLALQRAMGDPRRELSRHLVKLQSDIKTQQDLITKTKAEIQETTARLYAAQRSSGFFSPNPKSIEEELGIRQRFLQEDEQQLLELEADYKDLSTPSFPPGKTWTFNEVEAAIETLNHSYNTGVQTLLSLSDDPISGVNEQGQIGLLPFLAQLVNIAPRVDRSLTLFLKQWKVSDEIHALQQERRKLFPSFCADADMWDEFRLNTEIRQRRRNLAEISAHATGELLIGDDSTPRLANPFKVQERFLEDLIDYLEARLKKLSNAPPPSPPPPPTRSQKIADVMAEMAQIDTDRQAAVATFLKGRPRAQLSPQEENRVQQIENVFDDAHQRLLDRLRKI